MINDDFKNLIKKYNITETDKIICGTNIPKIKKVIPTPWEPYISFEEGKYYFFKFNNEGITIYSLDGENSETIYWHNVTDFEVSHIFIVGKMKIRTKTDEYVFQLNRFVLGCPWVSKNTKYLESQNYFYSNSGIKRY